MTNKISRLLFRLLATLSVGATSACSNPYPAEPDVAVVTNQQDSNESGETALGTQSEREFNFGNVVIDNSSILKHTYIVTNRSKASVVLGPFTNAKPCCGEVDSFEPLTLHPQEQAYLTVRLKGKAGDTIAHRALLETDIPGHSRIEFWTLATLHPRLRIIEASHQRNIIIGDTGQSTFTASALAQSQSTLDELDSMHLKCNLPCEWVSSSTDSKTESGLFARSRIFSVRINSGNKPGQYAEEISLNRDDTTLATSIIPWECVSVITASPAGIILSCASESSSASILVKSATGKPFVITKLDSTLPSLLSIMTKARQSKSTSQVVTIRLNKPPVPIQKTGQVIIETDAREQRSISVGILITK
jgi:hypothetical protein